MPHNLRHILYQLSWKAGLTHLSDAQTKNAEKLLRKLRFGPYSIEDYYSWELTLLLDSLPETVLSRVLQSGTELTGETIGAWSALETDQSLRAHAGSVPLECLMPGGEFNASSTAFGGVSSEHLKGEFWNTGDPDISLFTDYAAPEATAGKSYVLFENKTKAKLLPYQVIYYLNRLFWAGPVSGAFDFVGLAFVFDSEFEDALGRNGHAEEFRTDRTLWLREVEASANASDKKKITAVRTALQNEGRWQEFQTFCASVPVVFFRWHELLSQIMNELSRAGDESKGASAFARRIRLQAADLQAAVDSSHCDVAHSYERFGRLEKLTDHADALRAGRSWKEVSSRLQGFNDWTHQVLGAATTQLISEMESRPRVRFVPLQQNKNFQQENVSERCYGLFVNGDQLLSLKMNGSNGAVLSLHNGKKIRDTMKLPDLHASALGDIFSDLSGGRSRARVPADPRNCHQVLRGVADLLSLNDG